MKINELHKMVEETQQNICQMVIIKDGKTILNDTWNGFNENDTVHTMSVTKSIVSILIGIAIDKGLIDSVDDCVLKYFPDYVVKRGEKTIQDVTIKHLLTMSAPYKYKYEPWTKVCIQEDWTKAALDLLGGRCGITGKYKYSTLGIHILTGIIAKTSKMSTVEFANKVLFEPLGIAPREIYIAEDAMAHKRFTIEKVPKGNIWFSDPQGVGTAGYGLCLSAIEMAKIGLMCLNNGSYNNKQIVSSNWLKISTKKHITCDNQFRNMMYGYLWWIIDEENGTYAAIGNSGNVIYINPKDRLVVAIAAYFKPTVLDRIDFIKDVIEKMVLL